MGFDGVAASDKMERQRAMSREESRAVDIRTCMRPLGLEGAPNGRGEKIPVSRAYEMR
jgi:hypothetical protein